jgi:hypothetical protein
VDRESLQRLVNHIEENLRASMSAGLPFVDPRGHQERILTRQNHVVFGRRGAGKSTLLRSITDTDRLVVPLNLEDYKDVTFPNIVIQILRETFTELRTAHRTRRRFWRLRPSGRRLDKDLRNAADALQAELLKPDKEDIEVRTTEAATAGASLGADVAAGSIGAEVGAKSERSTSRSVPREKLTYLKNELPAFKRLVARAVELQRDDALFLILDDFHFVGKSIQPDCIDFFHRITKDTPLYLKVGTIRHRSRLMRRSSGQTIGVEVGHDILDVDMDYMLDRFEELRAFMRQLLVDATSTAGAQGEVDDLFAGEGFAQLCLASGGVPRDFLGLFVRLGSQIRSGEITRIGKVEVSEAAILAGRGKFDSLADDAGAEREILEHYLRMIKAYVYSTKRTNTFLVAKDDLVGYPHEAQAIRELVDLRLLHLADRNTSSAPSDGRRYEAYMVDVGLYDNSRPRNFTQLLPGAADEKSRRDALRAAPRLGLEDLRKGYLELNTQVDLALSDPPEA